jgi:large subunit ribosomal protein L22
MAVVAKLRFLRIAPRKVRLVADMIRGKRAEQALAILDFTVKKPSLSLKKLLNQAIANAKNNFQLESANLFISKITVDEGPKYKRWRARARGRAAEIQKKTSHITLVLDEIKKTRKTKRVKKEPAVAESSGEAREEKVVKPEKPKYKPEKETMKPKTEKGLRRIFRRKAF